MPLAYAVFRLQANRTVATIAAILLATSLWHFHFSRVAHWSITYPTVELLVLLFWSLGMRDGRWRWFILAGATLGFGMYTYNVYPIFVIAFAIWVALYTLLSRRGDKFRPWAMRVTAAAAVSVLVAMPLFLYIADGSNHYFEHYNQYYEHFSVLATDAFEQGDTGERIDIVTNQIEKWVGAYGWKGMQDYTDGAGANGEPIFDKLTVALLVSGVAYAVWNWRKTPHLMALLFFLIIPLTSVLQINSHYRGPARRGAVRPLPRGPATRVVLAAVRQRATAPFSGRCGLVLSPFSGLSRTPASIRTSGSGTTPGTSGLSIRRRSQRRRST